MKLTADEIEELFEQVLERPKAHRKSWLHRHCSDEASLQEIFSLLDAYDQAGEFLQQPLKIDVESTVESNLIGRQLGAYVIDGLIAYGGMGRVYRAHRNDGEYEQEVAVKLIESAHIDPALLKYERQILADLHHPNIVSLIDGGTLDEGVPYLVMEAIRGRPIHEYVWDESLPVRQIIILFCTLAKIVSQIHQHGVIHCDLKPDNILVTGEGDLKLLDFGVAHLYSAASADQVPFSRAVTAEYSSPQCRCDPLPRIGDDIYSLGIILGVLLSGQIPRVTIDNRDELNVDLTKIEATLSQELKAVFRKSTASEPTLRYQSVNELSKDLFYWLDEKPLNAMGSGYLYRTEKFLKRNWRKVMGGSVILILLVTMLIVWQLQKEKTDQAQSLAVAQVDSMLQELDYQMERLPGTTETRLAIVEATLKRLKSASQLQPST